MELFLRALGIGLLNSIWQMALLYGLFRCLCFFLVKDPAMRFRVGFLLALAGSFLFLATIIHTLVQPFYTWNNPLKIHLTAYPTFNYWFLIITGAIYILYLFLFILRQVSGLKQFKQSLKKIPQKIPVEWRLFIKKHATILEIKQKVKIMGTNILSPSTYGWLNPVILIPISCMSGMDIKSLEALIIHELAHIKRKDYLWHILLQVFEAILLPNPFMKALIKDTRLEAEKACDKWVLQFGYSAPMYAHALLQIAKMNSGNSASVTLAATGKKGQLLHRIKIILGNKVNDIIEPKWVLYYMITFCFFLYLGVSQKFIVLNHLIKDANTAHITYEFFQNKIKPQDFPNPIWKNQLAFARQSILKYQIGKRPATIQKETNKRVAKPEKEFAEKDLLANNKNTDETLLLEDATAKSGYTYLNANFTNSISTDYSANENLLIQTKATLTGLIDKLEEKGDLEEKEWKNLVTIVSLYHQLGLLIEQKNALKGHQILLNEDDKSKEVLLIVYDETTRLLMVTLREGNYLKETLGIKPNENKEGGKQVILLHKKKNGSSKEIKL